MLERRKTLALAPDERAERFLGFAFADDVEPARVARLHFDGDLEVHEAHQLLEDRLAGGERFGRRLRRFEIGPLGGQGPARGAHLGGLARAEVG